MKRQRTAAQMREQTRNTEVQKKKKSRGNRKITLKRIQNNDSKDDKKP